MEKKSKKKIILVLLLLFPLAIIGGTIAGVALPLVISYNNNAYEKVEDTYYANEEKILEEGLPGYTEYKQKVRWKILPFVW